MGWGFLGGYPAVRGKSYVEDVTFAYFNDRCEGRDVAIVPNSLNPDAHHPTTTQRITWVETDFTKRIFYFR